VKSTAFHEQLQARSESKASWKRIREALKESEQRLYSIIQGSPIPAFVIGKDHRVIYWNSALEELSKVRASEVIGTRQQWRAFYSAERPCMADLLVDETLDEIPVWYAGKYSKSQLIDEAYEATDVFPDLGRKGKWLRFTAAVIRNSQGELVGAIETLEDITERKLAEDALLKAHDRLEQRVRERTRELARANKALNVELAERARIEHDLKQTTERLSLILESLPVVSFTCNARADFTITFVSNTVEEITGYRPFEFVDNPAFWQEHLHPDDRRKVLAGMRTGLRAGTHTCGYRFRVADGSYKVFSDYRRIIRFPDHSRNHVIGAWRDVTEENTMRQEAELRLQHIIQTHKLTSLGEVVTGVAHEINNPISFISYNIPLLEEMWNTIEPVLLDNGQDSFPLSNKGMEIGEISQNMREIIEDFKIAANRITRVISGLKEFARADGTVQKKPVQIADVIHGALTIVGAQVRKTVSRIDQYIDNDLPAIPGHFQKIEQIVANLLINAHQAIPQGKKGRIVICARRVERLSALLIEIEDNGCGMEQALLDHIFEPFYTTRRDKDGTGLGLFISYGLVKEHDGLIGVLSRPGLGSRFTVFLPEEGRDNIELRPSILCINCDEAVLNELKLRFVDAHDWSGKDDLTGERLVSYLEEHPEVDMVIAEIAPQVPDTLGLLTPLKERFPLLPVILYSPDTAALRRARTCTVKADYIVKKPFDREQLQKIVRTVGRQRL
jgi:PAS domain S-box-containing protein